MADALYAATPTKLRNVALGVRAGSPGGHSSCFFSRAGTPVNPQSSPTAAFDTLFKDLAVAGGAPAGDDQVLRIRRQRQSVIDMVRSDLNDLCGRVGRSEKDKCDAHLSGLRQIESGLAQITGPVLATCTKPTRAASTMDLVAHMQAQMDIVAAALTCDLTRVATIQMGGPTAEWTRPASSITAPPTRWVTPS